MSVELDALTAQVTANTTVIQGAVTLIAGLRQQIIDAGTNPAALKALTDSLTTSDTALAAALVANTPGGTIVANLVSIAVTPANPSLGLGGTQQMVATGLLKDGTSSDITAQVVWKSDTPAAATVSTAGSVTGVQNGSATISATNGTFTGSTLATVAASVPAVRK